MPSRIHAAIIGGFAVTAQNQAIQIRSGRRALNSTDDTYLNLNEYDQPLAIEQPGTSYFVFKAIESVRTHKMQIRRLPEIGWCWELDSRVLPIKEAAAAAMHILLDRIDYRAKNPKPPGLFF